MHKVLLVEDDVEFCNLLKEYLEPDGFQVEAIHDGSDAVQQIHSISYDIIVLDVMLPQMNGFEVLRRIRETIDTPVLMLTARGEEVDRIVGLEMGADDYLAKPCNPRELLARLKAILRRTDKHTDSIVDASDQKQLTIDDIVIQPTAHEVFCKGKSVLLTTAEYKILEILVANAGRVVTKNLLSEQALARTMTQFDRSIDVHISKLRTKLGPRPDGNPRIKTIRGIGYLFISHTQQDSD